jgi:hypothetical protein
LLAMSGFVLWSWKGLEFAGRSYDCYCLVLFVA